MVGSVKSQAGSCHEKTLTGPCTQQHQPLATRANTNRKEHAMNGFCKAATLLLALTSIAVAQQAKNKEAPDPKVVAELISLDKQWIAAERDGNKSALSRILAEDYVFTDLNGEVGDRAKSLAHVEAGKAKAKTVTPDNYRVHLHGSTAVMTHRAKISAEGAAGVEAQAMHVWIKRRGRWQVVAHQWTLRSDELPRGLSRDFLLACTRYSFEPEVHTLFGNVKTIQQKLADDAMGLPDRRGYVILIETADSAELAFFDRINEQYFRVLHWEGDSVGELRERLTNTILENRGIACVGEQTKAMIKARLVLTDMGAIPTPVSARAAFSHLIKKHEGQY
ncbi:MAG: nuclear transport factor 2 family protein, partial [Terriglobales bacterium]